jgi:biopolymer transport protein ExbD
VIILRADKDALHGHLTDVMARAKDAGAQSMTIATEQPR